MQRISQTGDQSGFTLLELLLAMTLSAVVLSAVYGIFTTAIDANRRISRTATELQAWRFFTERLRSDLNNLMTGDLSLSYSLSGDGDTLTLWYAPQEGIPGFISYTQKNGANGSHIRRTTLQNKNEAGEQADVDNEGSVIFNNIETLSFRYLTDGEWSTETGVAFPTAVESTVIADGRRRAVVISLEVEPLKI